MEAEAGSGAHGPDLIYHDHCIPLYTNVTDVALVHTAYRVSAKRSSCFNRRPARELQLGCIPLRRVPVR